MKILFVIPNFMNRTREYLILPSIEVCIMSSVLKNEGHLVDMCDMRILDMSPDELKTELLSKQPDIICIDDIPESHCFTKKILPVIRATLPDVLICIRGEMESFEPRMFMERNPEIDFILRYETDYAISNIIKCLNNKIDFSEVGSIAYRNGDEIILTPVVPTDISSLPMPDREIYDIDLYLKRDSETIVKSSRGCPGKCLFCIKTKYEPFKIFPMNRFCAEIEQLQNMGFKSFFFSDDNFAFSMKRLLDFKEELEKRNLKIKWTSNLRLVDITDEKIALMKELGAYRVFIGIETLNSNTSTLINKNLSKDFILDKIRILNKHDMQFHASFILGNPGDVEADLQETLDFVKEVKPDLVTFNLIKIYPGLDLYKDPEKYGMVMEDPYWFESDRWTYDVVMGTKDLPPEVLKRWSKRMLYEYIISK